jgi:chromosome segregation ATPase
MTNNENKNFKKPNHAYTKAEREYSYYSRVLNKPFDSIEELREAEAAYRAEVQAKEDKAAQKKADAQKVEDAFKAMNAARREYKEKLTQLTKEYSEELTNLKKAFELGKKDIHDALAAAEENYSKALKEFTSKYDQYHVTLKDGDFETTISGSQTKNVKKEDNSLLNIFDLLFNF